MRKRRVWRGRVYEGSLPVRKVESPTGGWVEVPMCYESIGPITPLLASGLKDDEVLHCRKNANHKEKHSGWNTRISCQW